MVKVNVKWNKQVFEVDLDTSDTAVTFKTQLWTLTGVPVERQKLMCRGGWRGVLADNADLSACKIKEGQQVMLMGSAEVMKAPQEKVVFVEDMTQEEQAKAGAAFPAGLVNLGNTCYMNSTLECLRHVPELREGLDKFAGAGGGGTQPSATFTRALAQTFTRLDASTESIPPIAFVQVLRDLYPQFAQQGPRGGYMQQDAEELLGATLTSLSQNLKEPASLPDLGSTSNLIDALFGLEVEEKLVCQESEAEPSSVRKDHTRKLVCNIQGGAGSTDQINHLHEGVLLGLEGSVEKRSEILERDVLWSKTQRVTRLPRYICVQFMRFFWKATPDSQDHAGVKCKIMKPVSFPTVLDTYPFCSDSLKAVLDVGRKRKADEILGKEAEGNKKPAADESLPPPPPTEEKKEDQKMEDAAPSAEDEEKKALEAALALSMDTSTEESKPAEAPAGAAGPGLPEGFMGHYELFGVVTHKGREADGGHYMGWVKQKKEEGSNWHVFDDADVGECTEEDIVNLKGGGDWHMAYLVFYRYKE